MKCVNIIDLWEGHHILFIFSNSDDCELTLNSRDKKNKKIK